MGSVCGEEKRWHQQKSTDIFINNDFFYSVLLYRELSNNYKLTVNVSF